MNIAPHIAKGARFTIGARIESKFLDLLELSYAAPIEMQYTYVHQNGVFVDPELNGVYFMTTLSGGVMVDSVGWSLGRSLK